MALQTLRGKMRQACERYRGRPALTDNVHSVFKTRDKVLKQERLQMGQDWSLCFCPNVGQILIKFGKYLGEKMKISAYFSPLLLY